MPHHTQHKSAKDSKTAKTNGGRTC